MISVIIPVYNAGQYVSRCLDSLLQQTYQEWETIVIDDGSQDDSIKIITSYAQRDQRFRVVTKENEGVSKTRNRALELSRGEYLFFLDADDYLMHPQCFDILVNEISKESVDFVRFEYVGVDSNGNHLFSNGNKALRKRYFYKPVDAGEYCLNVARGEYFLCMNLIRNSIVKENSIRFVEGCRIREDAIFLLTYLCYSAKAIYIPNELYAYRKHNSAATSSRKENYTNDFSIVFDHLFDLLQGCKKAQFVKVISYYLCDLVLELRHTSTFNQKNELVKGMRYHTKKYIFSRCVDYNDTLLRGYELGVKVLNKLHSTIFSYGSKQ